MTQTDTGATLNKLRKMIQTLQREEMVQIQRTQRCTRTDHFACTTA